ncbi:MAG: hypothetical protein R3C18_23385 [Planctomycetaceae bacterium]
MRNDSLAVRLADHYETTGTVPIDTPATLKKALRTKAYGKDRPWIDEIVPTSLAYHRHDLTLDHHQRLVEQYVPTLYRMFDYEEPKQLLIHLVDACNSDTCLGSPTMKAVAAVAIDELISGIEWTPASRSAADTEVENASTSFGELICQSGEDGVKLYQRFFSAYESEMSKRKSKNGSPDLGPNLDNQVSAASARDLLRNPPAYQAVAGRNQARSDMRRHRRRPAIYSIDKNRESFGDSFDADSWTPSDSYASEYIKLWRETREEAGIEMLSSAAYGRLVQKLTLRQLSQKRTLMELLGREWTNDSAIDADHQFTVSVRREYERIGANSESSWRLRRRRR